MWREVGRCDEIWGDTCGGQVEAVEAEDGGRAAVAHEARVLRLVCLALRLVGSGSGSGFGFGFAFGFGLGLGSALPRAWLAKTRMPLKMTLRMGLNISSHWMNSAAHLVRGDIGRDRGI